MRPSQIISLALAVVVGYAAAAFWVGRRESARHATELETARASWAADKAALEVALEKARSRTAIVEMPVATEPLPPVTPAVIKPDPQAILDELTRLKVAANQPRAMRRVIALLEQLSDAGTAALPVISQFLATGNDVTYEAGGRAPRDLQGIVSSLAPLTLRFGLFDVVRQIGGDDAEAVLATSLGKTLRGVELAYLTELVEQLAPGKYRDTALATAKGLMATTAAGADRDYLFSVLKRFGDDSYVATAQAQLVQADGKVDRSALKYLQQTLGDKSVALAAQTYKDARVTEADSKESLARVALAYVGANEQAGELFHAAVLDQTLNPDQHRNLIEDLNQDGLANRRAPTAEDLKIITRRYEITQAYLQQDYVINNKTLNAAFREADKDLGNLLQRAAANAASPK
jgi:hypothetical protein